MTTEHADNEILQEDQDWLQSQVNSLTFGRMLKAHRLSEEWTLDKAATSLGVQKQLLSAYENGRKLPSPKKAYEIAEKLGMVPESAVLAAINDQLRQDELPIKVQLAS
jgi:transcriptional regulator with XRE-family HTH domain